MTTPVLFYPAAPTIRGFNAATQTVFDALWGQWVRKQPGNAKRLLYLDAKQQFKDLHIALPPNLVDKLDVCFGWPEKSVYEIANRIVLEDWHTPDTDNDPFGLKPILRANKFRTEFRNAVVSSAAQSVSFASVTPGDVARGEPDVLLMFHSALFATGLWDRRLRAMTSALIINETNDLGAPILATVMFPRVTYVVRDAGNGWYLEHEIANPTGRLMFRALPYRPNLDRPFGKARIDRPTMSLTDRAVRASGRLEIHSELFATLKLMIMGADESTFKDTDGNTIPLWSFVMGRLNGIPKDEDGDVPKLETITAQSPEPHIATLREIASEFSGHTGVPLSALGVSSANPESADAKRVGREDIVNDAESQQDVYGSEILSLFEDIVMIRDGLTSPPDEMGRLSLQWRSPERITAAAAADAGSKQVASIPGLAETKVGMEMVGMTPSQIERAQEELRRAGSKNLLDSLLARREPEPLGEAELEDEMVTAIGDAR